MINYLFPRLCHLCSSPLTGKERHLCGSCFSRLPRTLYHRQPANPMEQRFAGLFPFERASGHFFYSSGSEISELMQDLKYRKFGRLARFMGETMGKELLISGFLNDIEAIVPIPMHFLKKSRRGYNPAELIAEGLGRETEIRVERWLRALRPHSTQTGLSPEQRATNLRNVFDAARIPQGEINLLLLDDVCTTGTTLTEAALTICNVNPSAKISILTLGVTF